MIFPRNNATLGIALVAAVVLGLLPSCGKDGPHRNEPVTLAGRLPDGPTARVVFIGLDGATWNVIDPLIEQGELPTFKKLKEEGAWCNLRSTECFISSPAWGAMMTGCLPEKMGIYSFTVIDSFSRPPMAANSRDIMVPSVWDIASTADLTTGVVNIPLTYPLRPVNGIMVTGFLTPNIILQKKGNYEIVDFLVARMGELKRKTGRTSFSPPLKGRRTIYNNRNLLDIYLIDTTDNEREDHDTACVIITPMTKNIIERSEIQKVFCKIDSLTPWVKINFPGDQAQNWKWVRIRIENMEDSESHQRQLKVKCFPVYFALEDTTMTYCYPPDLRQSMARNLTRYFPYVGFDNSMILDYVVDKGEHLNYFYRYDDWDFFLFEFQEPDQLQHRNGFGPYTRELYRRMDKIFGEFIESLPDNTILMMASDHGFKNYKYMITVNAWFESLGLLKWKDAHSVNWDESFAYHYQWNVYVNRVRLEKEYRSIRGFEVPSGADVYETFLDWLIERGTGAIRPETGEKMPIGFSRYRTPHLGHCPDLCVTGGQGDHLILMMNRQNEMRDVLTVLDRNNRYHCYHEQDGIFLAWGEHIKNGYQAETKSIMDVAPTMLYALGLPMAEYMDGTVMLDLFENEFARRNPVEVYANYADLDYVGSKGDIDDAERAKIEEQMRALGYIE